MKIIKKYAACFTVGGVGYGIIELLWRGHTHWTMILAGGICFAVFTVIAEKCREIPIAYKVALAAACVTTVELIFGVVFNIWLRMDVWDYSKMRFNLFGQICPLYSLLWCALSAAALPLAEFISKKCDSRCRATA